MAYRDKQKLRDYRRSYRTKNRERLKAKSKAYNDATVLERKFARIYGVGIPRARQMVGEP